MPCMGGYERHKQLLAPSLCERVLLHCAAPPSRPHDGCAPGLVRPTLRRASGQGRERHSAAWTGAIRSRRITLLGISWSEELGKGDVGGERLSTLRGMRQLCTVCTSLGRPRALL